MKKNKSLANMDAKLIWAQIPKRIDQLEDCIHFYKVKKAQEYLPDIKGYTPLDYAGFFRHFKVIKYFIQRMVGDCQKAMEDYVPPSPAKSPKGKGKIEF